MSAAAAATIYVPADYPTIQGAIEAASGGDTIVVSKGRYRENLDFGGKGVTVRSTRPTVAAVVAGTIIDGTHSGSVVIFKTAETRASVLKGFTLINGNGALSSGNRHGGGISCWNGASPTISDNVIRNNAVVWSGGGVYSYASSPLLTRNTITANTAGVRGGGVSLEGGSAAELVNNTISSNVACDASSGASAFGGGIYCELSSDVEVTGNRILENRAGSTGNTGFGGGVDCYACAPALSANVVRGNQALGGFVGGCGGGICAGYAGDSCAPAISGNTISGNSAASGGGLYCNGTSLVTNNVIAGNTATSGGGVYCGILAAPSLINDTISGNSATEGGGVYCGDDSAPVLRNTIVSFSTAGGGLFALVDLVSPPRPAVTYCDFYENTGGNYVNCTNPTGTAGNVSRNPLFANAAGGDFHLKSRGGRWDAGAKAWVVDTAHSLCIDAGAPKNRYALEPAPNGARINMGAAGNTRYASKSAPAGSAGEVLVTAAATPLAGGAAIVTVRLTAAAEVQARILNVAGREVAALAGRRLAPGLSTLAWNGRSSGGTKVPAGRYLVQVTACGSAGACAEALVGLVVR